MKKDKATPETEAEKPDTEAPEQEAPEEPPEAPANDFESNPDIMAYIDKQINEGIRKALKGKAPKASTTDPSEAEKAEFNRMTYKERLQLFQSNPQAYQKLKGGQ